MVGAVCDRCGAPYLAPHVPSHLCPDCFLGALTPTDRARLLGAISPLPEGIFHDS